MPNVWHVFSFYNSTFAKREVKEVREFKEFIGVKAICFIAKYTTKKAIGYNFFNYYTFRTCETSVNDIYVISSAHPTNPVEGCADANPKTELPNDT